MNKEIRSIKQTLREARAREEVVKMGCKLVDYEAYRDYTDKVSAQFLVLTFIAVIAGAVVALLAAGVL